MKDRVKIWIDSLNLSKRDIWAAVISIVVTGTIILDSVFFQYRVLEALFITDGIGLGIILIVIMILTGFRVMRALVEVAAGLSLLIFLAQTYCNSSGLTTSSNEALKSLFTIGLIYLSYYFLLTLGKLFIADLKKIRDKGRSWQETVFVILYTVFTILFIWEIWLVMNPIIKGLCVYK